MPIEVKNMEVNTLASLVKRKYDNEIKTTFKPILKFAKMTDHAYTRQKGQN